MNIKSYLKSINITQLELAEKLSLSRPTLDSYILQFQSNEILSREKYQIVFEQLFAEPLKNESQFRDTLDKLEVFLKQDLTLDLADMRIKDSFILSLVTSEIKRDLQRPDADLDIYVFINLILFNYRKNKSIKQIVNYFLLLYSRKEDDEISESDKVFISNLYEINTKELKFKKDAYESLLKEAQKYSGKKSGIQKKIQNQLIEKLENKISELTEAGVEINIDEFDLLYKEEKIESSD